MKWEGTGLTDRGKVRASKQDAFAINNPLQLWVVADGMGGRPGGDIASQIAVNTIMTSIQESMADTQGEPAHQQAILEIAMKSANTAIREEVQRRPKLAGMGTTAVLLWISSSPPSQATIVHIGDSRAYLLQQDTITQLSTDHSWVIEQIQQGLLSPEEASIHPMQNAITRALGIEPTSAPDIRTLALQPTDRVLLCTDGLTKMMSDQQIFNRTSSSQRSREDYCQELITEANRLGGQDNTTVIIVGQNGQP
ncbi:MAG: Stp1/IreP family PP2C-type Ser/Thr phosphatase [Nitrospirales bacterium]|nr:Stp1/IreP family PP2C-type Ser/Thr phosphatase [Nitrospirales bacterium]